MKNKKIISTVIFCLIFTVLFGSVTCVAKMPCEYTVEAENVLDGILSNNGIYEKNIQSWIDGYLCENPATGAEWYVISLSQYGKFDFSKYEKSLLLYLENNKISSASSRLKFALCLSATGSTNKYISETIDNSIGKQGIMSWIFGLHLLNNGYKSESYTVGEIVDKIVSLQCENGGWSVIGNHADADATAMAIQAISPYYKRDCDVETAINKGISALSNMQLDDGDFASYGVPNAESTAQVIIALSSLGIDCTSDARFIKNGKNPFDGIGKYEIESGGFGHKNNSEKSEVATVQAFMAMVSYLRFAEGKGSIYLLDGANPDAVEGPQEGQNGSQEGQNGATGGSDGATEGTNEGISESSDINDENSGEIYENETNGSANSSNGFWKQNKTKIIIISCVIGFGGIICAVLFIFKKRNVKDYLIILAVVLIAVLIIIFVDIKTPDDYYNDASTALDDSTVIGKVTFEIRCDTVIGEADYVPQNGVILSSGEYDIHNDDTVYSLLSRIAKIEKIQIDSSKTGSGVYVSGIGGIYEFDFGELSGWIYKVNGKVPSLSASEFKLSDGDVVVWYYTKNLGNDITQ